jgi:hypothetical protein
MTHKSHKPAQDPNRPRPAHKLNLQPGDAIAICDIQEKAREALQSWIGRILVVSKDGKWLVDPSSPQAPHSIEQPKGFGFIGTVITRAADKPAEPATHGTVEAAAQSLLDAIRVWRWIPGIDWDKHVQPAVMRLERALKGGA